MRFLLPALLALGTAGCVTEADVSDEILDDYATQVETMQDDVATWHDDVQGAQSMHEVDGCTEDYQQHMDDSIADMHHTLDDMEGCEMGHMGRDHMHHAHQDLQALDDEMAALHQAHGQHGETAQCGEMAADHAQWMHGTLEEMHDHHEAMRGDTMHCAHHAEHHQGGGHHGGGHQGGGPVD